MLIFNTGGLQIRQNSANPPEQGSPEQRKSARTVIRVQHLKLTNKN
ncbi:MAG: hypothetical protein IKQ37_09635 [Bacteroidaceae bacterium]|nr:hypothetical protein [Bacteroidaceae bacterium]